MEVKSSLKEFFQLGFVMLVLGGEYWDWEVRAKYIGFT
jgi:hypothetical protein